MPTPSKNLAAELLPPADWGKELVNWLFPTYVTAILVSVFLFLLKSMMAQGNAMSFDRAVLTAVNTATCTGFQLKLGPNYFKPPGQVLILLLTIAGALFSLVVGGLAVRRILRLRYTDTQIVNAALISLTAALLLGALGAAGVHPTLLEGLSQGASAFGNSGVALGRPFDVGAGQVHALVLPMIFLGGLGITVLMELYDLLLHGQPLSTHARTVLAWSVGLYLGGVVVFTLLQLLASRADGQLAKALVSSSVASINSRTAGVPFEFASAYPAAMRWVLMPFMLVGAAPGGTGGGLKVTTLAVLFTATRQLIRGGPAGRPLGIALSWLGLYLAIALLGLVMLLFVEPQLSGEQILFLTISALSNVGLSHNPLPDMPRGAFVLAALMMAGRMVPLLVLWWMADTTTDADTAIG